MSCNCEWGGHRTAHCPTCHLTFVSEVGFDVHRVGDFEPLSRRCLSEAELRELGWEPNEQGYWHQHRPTEAAA